jgi:predicted ATPase/class 3 adenylate cyclase/DNA-binding CsgD family transcriptional regulator
MVASMSEIDPRADTPPVNWSDLAMTVLLPTGTVTLLLADVEGSTRLWETQTEEMTAAVALLDRTVTEIIATHDGVRPVEQGEGDSFVAAFARASDAVASALELQRAPLAPIRLRIGVHTGEVQLRDEGNYIGPAVNRTARLRDLAHGGQTVLSGTTGDLVADRLPPDVWLTDLGSHKLRDLPRPERVMQLCHSDLHSEFPPLRTANTVVTQNLPVQLTSFVGREAEMHTVRQLLTDDRLVTLTGAGGAGKTRLAAEVARLIAGEFGEGVRYVDLAPITDPEIVPVTVARAFGLPDQPGSSTMETLLRFVGDGQILLVLDNCEHLLDASAELSVALLGACPGLTLLATSREPIGVAGEVTWRVPSLSLDDEALELFTDRARRARPDFTVGGDDIAVVEEICRHLDGMPLAIELAAARVRALSLTEIVASLHDRFRLLTGGARSAVRRQQTLRASVDWSHALLTEPERILFRRLAAFMGGFDLDAAQAVCGGGELERYHVLDQLTLLVDKSLVVAENTKGPTRYRMLETVRQYAQEMLGESGEADAVRARHRDHYTSMAAMLDTPAQAGHQRRIEQTETEIDNLRAAFAWSYESSDIEQALRLASSLQPLWLTRGPIREGLGWFDLALTNDNSQHPHVAPAVRAGALADRVVLAAYLSAVDSMDQAQQALAIARELDDPALLARALTACGSIAAYDAKTARPYLTESIELARALGDNWTLSQALGWLAYAADTAGEPIVAGAAAEEGRDLANALGYRFHSRRCRHRLGLALLMQGDLRESIAQFGEVIIEADAAHDVLSRVGSLFNQAQVLAYHGDTSAARATIEAAFETVSELGEFMEGFAYAVVAIIGLAAGDVAAATDASEAAWQRLSAQGDLGAINLNPMAEVALARGDLVAARRWVDDAVSVMKGWHLATALTTGARVAIAQGELDRAEHDAHEALTVAEATGSHMAVPEILECLAALAGTAGAHRQAARHFGAADTLRQRTGTARYKIHDAHYHASVAVVRDAMGENDFEDARAQGAAMSTDEAIAYAQRGRGERKRPTSGWGSLPPTERDVVRLVSEGLANKDIATRLFVSPRTVQTHLTHVYTKLGLTSRVQLAQEAARHT